MRLNLYKLSFCFLILLVVYSSQSWGGVYQCVDEKGAIEFRDTPCDAPEKTFLPIQYSKTPLKNGKKDLEKQEKKFHKMAKQQAIENRKQERARLSNEKKASKLKEKEKRRNARCLRTREKIQEIENKLRGGRKIKGFNRLKEELEHHRRMEHHYCDLKDTESF